MLEIINIDMQRSQIKSRMATAEAYQRQKYDSVKKRLESDEKLSSIFLDIEDYPTDERCRHCGKFACDVIYMGEEKNYDSCYTYLCFDCLRKASKIVDKDTSVMARKFCENALAIIIATWILWYCWDYSKF